MSVGFEHHQETHVPNISNSSIRSGGGGGTHLTGSSSSHLGSHGATLTFPHLRHHHHSRNHGSNGSSPTPFQPNTSSRSRDFPHELSSRGAYGESETFSRATNRFSSSLSSPSLRSGRNMSGHHHQNHDNDSLLEDHLRSNGDPSGFSSFEQLATDFPGSNSTYKTFTEQRLVTSVERAHSFTNFTQSPSFNLSFDDVMATLHTQNEDNGSSTTSYFYNSTNGDVTEGINATRDSATVSIRVNLYAYIVPVMLFFCVLAVLVNLIIVISARWCRKPMSPTLYFSISLALADAYAAFILATGLVLNSLLPYVFGYQRVPVCLSLVVEAFRQGGVLVTVSHLLALAMNHWIGIVRPLHYAATMTRRTAWMVIILSWICPITVIFIYFSSMTGEGFQSSGCNYMFLKKRTYRAFFASCFFAPLILMSFIYIHIFIIVRNHHTHRQRYQNTQTQQLKRNVKAVLTTMLVLGTYVIGWMPATLFSLIACNDCAYHPDSLPSAVRYSVGFISNLLVILKTLVDPVIYAARMSDIQLALKKMRYDILSKFCKSCAPATPPNDRGSFYETKSMRMTSFGSRSSTRRLPDGNASLIRHPNGNQLLHNQSTHRLLKQHNGTGSNGYAQCATEACVGPRSALDTNGRRSFIEISQSQALINSKAALEMKETN